MTKEVAMTCQIWETKGHHDISRTKDVAFGNSNPLQCSQTIPYIRLTLKEPMARAISLSTDFCILPVEFIGRSSLIITDLGTM
uniref:Uncharacterized protein MANES_18G109700 n=1 Tax=Rhizophora mucronata TaxID=61149 RepID=A0A2P2P0M4_RHIMU